MSRTLKVKRCQVPCQKTRKVLLFLSGYFCSLPKRPRNMRSTWNSVWLELGLQMIKWQVFVSWSIFLLVGKHHWTDPWQVIQQKESKDLTQRLGKTLRSILFETKIIEWLVEFYQCVTFFFGFLVTDLGLFRFATSRCILQHFAMGYRVAADELVGSDVQTSAGPGHSVEARDLGCFFEAWSPDAPNVWIIYLHFFGWKNGHMNWTRAFKGNERTYMPYTTEHLG